MNTLRARIESKIAISDSSGCWEWTGWVMPNGYGQIHRDGKTAYAHRASYETFVGPIPEGCDLDHLCRNRKCVNPDHLEPVTRLVNLHRGETTRTAINAKKTHCIRGHPFDETNTYLTKNRRQCKACSRMFDKQRQPRRKR